MEYVIAVVTVIVLSTIVVALVNRHKRKQEELRQRQLLEQLEQDRLAREKQALTTFLKSQLAEVWRALLAFSAYCSQEAGYFAQYSWHHWHRQHTPLFQRLNDKPINNSSLESESIADIASFLDHYNNGETHRRQHNAEFLRTELIAYERFFNNIEGRALDLQQRTAIINNEDNSLIIAGAGSGKTTTIVGKVNYVMQRYAVLPTNILLISFTKKSATSLADRIKTDGVVANTFHKLGKDIICEVEGKQPSIFDENQFGFLIDRYFKDLLKEPRYTQKVTDFFTLYLKPDKKADEFKNQGEYIQFLKDQNIRSYKQVPLYARGKTSLKREVVKSIEECRIANFLLFNGIDYKYECRYEHDTATPLHSRWKPDFTIEQQGKVVYLEHFGISREGEVPAFFAKPGQTRAQASQRYREKMDWARSTSERYGTTLIESYSYEMSEGSLFKYLEENLIKLGIQFSPMAPYEIWETISESAEDEVKGFKRLFQTFITLMKSNDYTMKDVLHVNSKIADERQRQRNALFIEIIAPIYERYQQELVKREEIDFSDMISKAVGYVNSGQYRSKFEYIIIDEFQDISKGRYRLINALRQQNPSSKTFCVGDDWQSIYRFSGSDIALFKDFDQYFEGATVHSKIETTYRFHNPLIDLSSSFILKNPNQTQKDLKSAMATKRTDYRIVYSINGQQDDTLALKQTLDELITQIPNIASKEIYVLSRYTHDLPSRVKNEDKIFNIDLGAGTIGYWYEDSLAQPHQLHVQFYTVHKSKGLEADIVIILNCNSGKYGFPSGMSDDAVLNLLLSEADQYENGEERRLFYVAMTRAKEQVIFIADQAFKSKFITELEVASPQIILRKCPVCVTADMELKSGVTNGRQWGFYGCSNFNFGCDYREGWLNMEAVSVT